MRTWTVTIVCLCILAGGCKKKAATTASAKTPEPAPVAAAPAAAAAPDNTNFQPGAGAVQNVRNAVKRTVALTDMQQLGQLVELMFNDGGRMPDAATIKASVQRDAPKIASAIADGSIVLTGTNNHGGLWAYESGADTSGGIGLVGGTASRMSADQIKQYLGR